MNYVNNIWIVLLLLGISCKKPQKEVVPNTNTVKNTYASSDYLIEAEELFQMLDSKNIKIIDFRKKEEYSTGHLPKALNIWRSDVEDTTYPFRGMLPKKETVETLFSRLGIANLDTIVVYDYKGSSDAARFWWILKTYGFKPVRILNGGLMAWETIDGAISTETSATIQTDFKLPSNTSSEVLATKEDVIAAISKDHRRTHLIDVRTTEEYSGKITKDGAAKGGRIPKSIHIDWVEAIDYEGTKKFRTHAELDKIYEQIGASKSDTIILYCHSGVRAAHTTFVLTELLGFENVKNYDGSWTEWSRSDDLPFEKDSITIVNK